MNWKCQYSIAIDIRLHSFPQQYQATHAASGKYESENITKFLHNDLYTYISLWLLLHRWRFLNGSWQKGSTSEDNAEHRHVFVHFSSLAPGSHWMQEPVSFAKLKLSNRENGSSKVRLCVCMCVQHLMNYMLTIDPTQLPSQVSTLHSPHWDELRS